MPHGLTGKPVARLTLVVTVVDEDGELYCESEMKTTMLRKGDDVRQYEPLMIEWGQDSLLEAAQSGL
jgi:hypothetical protein